MTANATVGAPLATRDTAPPVTDPPARRAPLFDAAHDTYAGFLCARWAQVCAGLGVDRRDWEPVAGLISGLLAPWGHRAIGTRCRYPSFVAADGFPAELSVSWRAAGPEIRVLFESLGDGDGPMSSQSAGLALTDRLGTEPGVHLGAFRRVQDLFQSSSPAWGRPTVWHSLAWLPGHAPQYKVYLNPQLNGPAEQVVAEAMGRLGMAGAWRYVAERHAERLDHGDEIDFFALDLTDPARARTKVYYRHRDITADALNRFAALSTGHRTDAGAAALRTVYPDRTLLRNEPLSCLAFRRDEPRPVTTNWYLRLPANASSERAAADRIGTLLSTHGVDGSRYRRLVRELCPVPLERGTGMQELVSYRGTDRGVELGVYLRFPVYREEPAPRDGGGSRPHTG